MPVSDEVTRSGSGAKQRGMTQGEIDRLSLGLDAAEKIGKRLDRCKVGSNRFNELWPDYIKSVLSAVGTSRLG